MKAIVTSGFAGSLLARGAALGIGLLVNVVLARALGPSELGAYAFVLAVIALFVVPVHSGLAVLLIREIARAMESKAWGRVRGSVQAANLTVLAVSGVAVALGGIVWASSDRAFDARLWGYGLLLLPLMGLASLRDAALRGLQRPLLGQVPDTLIRPALLCAGLLFVGYSDTVFASDAMFLHCIAAALAFAFGSVVLVRLLPEAVRAAAPEFQWSGWRVALVPFTALAAVQALNGAIPVMALGASRPDADIGFYRIGELGASLVAFGLIAGDMVFAPRVVGLIASGDRAELQRQMTLMSRLMVLCALPVAVATVFFGEPLIKLFFGAEYVDARWPLAILSVAQLVNSGTGPVGSLLNMSGHERETLRGVAFAICLNLALSAALVPTYGAIGAAWAAGGSLVALNAVWAWRAWRLLGVRCVVR